MSRLFNTQPEDREPIEYTHFDCWFMGEDDTDLDEGIDLFNEATDEALAKRLGEILDGWERSLGMTIPRADSLAVGVDYALDVAIVAILEHGYDIYKGEMFIEIFKGEDA